MTEKEKMLAGKLYDSFDRELAQIKKATRNILTNYNATTESEQFRRQRFLRKLLGSLGKDIRIEPHLYTEYGVNTYIGESLISGYNLTIIDSARVTIGDNCFLGSNVTISTDIHPFLARERNLKTRKNGREILYKYARPVKVGNNVWIGNDVTINPGVSIGDGAVIMAGSVVTGAIPVNVIAAGFPCKVLREISENDSVLTEELYEGIETPEEITYTVDADETVAVALETPEETVSETEKVSATTETLPEKLTEEDEYSKKESNISELANNGEKDNVPLEYRNEMFSLEEAK